MEKDFLELYKNPQNFGIIKNPTNEATETITCGDELTAQLIIKENKIKEIKFKGSGCMICIVAASLLANKVKGMNVEDVKKMNKENILKLLNTKINSSRINCAVLPLKAIKNSLKYPKGHK